ncbi:nucleoside deaminase [sulfur-oxidizing endosymbiont of Gigantopelta aegis]|uniref:nucleoside deaminase n=1 Tax=sulfur-oxidizing endosymbiont of Gigantopelta aegis TaxID=2794934 RepID=UPI001FECB899|nr:nucleoside deaminase [sulfur-oxidizing endosymbiont of Gigantopelta aegis]
MSKTPTHQFMQSAIKLASQSIQQQGGPFGAVIVKDNKIIGRGSNQVTRHHDPTAHAEVEAIRDACHTLQSHSLQGCTLYASSEPCPMCLSAIYWAHLDGVYYANAYAQASKIGFDDAFIFQELSLPHSEKKLPIEQIHAPDLLNEAQNVFKQWENSPDKKAY